MSWIEPDWPAPAHVKAVCTTRLGGYSQLPYDSLNLGTHVEDELETVLRNRQYLQASLNLPEEPLWLEQIHSTVVADADREQPEITADASVSHQTGKVCVVMTADCLPVLFTNQEGSVIAAAHAGWRGLNEGVLEATVNSMKCPVDEILAWLGPAIGPENFEVGEEVREAFVEKHPEADKAFVAGQEKGKWYADIYQLARIRLAACGVDKVYGGGFCTFADAKRFFSYRREGQTGRMASLIWIDHPGILS